MKPILTLLLAAILSPVLSADDYIVGGTSGTKFIFGRLTETNGRLNLTASATYEAPGTVGIIDLFVKRNPTVDAYFSFTKKGGPAYGRFSVRSDDRSTFWFEDSRVFTQPLGSYSSLGVFQGSSSSQAYFFRTQKSTKADLFSFPVNSFGNPAGPKLKFLDHAGKTFIRGGYGISYGGSHGIGNIVLPSGANVLDIFTLNDQAVVQNFRFAVANPLINVSISNPTTAGNPIFVYRELSGSGINYKTAVFARPFITSTGTPGAARRLFVGDAGAPGTFQFNSLPFNTSEISPDGRWVFWGVFSPACNAYEMKARRLNPKGGFAGPTQLPFGSCNVFLGDGSPVNFRSISVAEFETVP